MLNLTEELNNFITVLYGHGPRMNKTWQELYPEAFTKIEKDLFRLHVSSARASVPCDQTFFLSFLVFEEKTYINNAKFIHPLEQADAMKLLQISAVIRTKVQEEYNIRIAKKRAAKNKS